MALDTATEITENLAPALRAVANAHRLEILRVLDGGEAGADAIARQLNLPRRAIDRHLALLQDCGLVRLQPGSDNGRTYALDREKAAMLNASFVSVLGRVASAEGTVSPDAGVAPDEALPMVMQAPDACTRCQNNAFVLQMLDRLDMSIVQARQYQTRLRQMSSQVLTAQEEERKRIARELHDDTAQALTSVLVRLRLLERSSDAKLRGRLTELRDLTGETLEGVRRMAIDLRPPMLDDLGLEAALQAQAEDFSRRWPVRATFSSTRVGRLSPDVELVLYRIVQEALSNVAKHANATRVDAHLARRGRTLRLVVEDDGCGFDVDAMRSSRESGLGLFGMEERLALVGGTVRVESEVGRGTRVMAEVPLARTRRR